MSLALLKWQGHPGLSQPWHPRRRTHLSTIFNNVMTLCAMVPLLIFTCLNSFLHQRSRPPRPHPDPHASLPSLGWALASPHLCTTASSLTWDPQSVCGSWAAWWPSVDVPDHCILVGVPLHELSFFVIT